jgi:UDP-2,3-diacylglucosamine hydrolase
MPTPPAPIPAPAAPSAALPEFYALRAPADWHTVDFISDLHLQESEPATFEVWVGDDVMGQAGHGFEARCRHVLHHCALNKPLYFMHGNRDFLVGNIFLHDCGMHLLPDPSVLILGPQRFLLSHGDALCLADTDYQTFRAQVRSHAWQTAFLDRPLPERVQMARDMRAQSEARKQQAGPWVDLDPLETQRWMDASGAHHMVHGHTHEGADHPLRGPADSPATRHVLSDWDAGATPPRAQVLRLSTQHGARPAAERLSVL